MVKVLSVANVKGGVAKSISAMFFANIMADRGNKVLLIDIDSQNSLTSFYINNYVDIENNTIFELLLGKVSIENTIRHLRHNLDFIPADIMLNNLTLQLTENRDYKLYIILGYIKDRYNYIIIDTPPNLHIETKLSLVNSNIVIIPTLLEKWAVRSIDIILNYIRYKNIELQKLVNVQLEKILIVPTLLEKNRKLQTIILHELEEKYPDMVTKGVSKKVDVQKLSYIGPKFDLKKLYTYKEYELILDNFIFNS